MYTHEDGPVRRVDAPAFILKRQWMEIKHGEWATTFGRIEMAPLVENIEDDDKSNIKWEVKIYVFLKTIENENHLLRLHFIND